MKPITLTQEQFDAAFGGPMSVTISDVQSRAQSIADEIERAEFNPLAVPPATEEILDILRDVEIAEPDDCEDCGSLEESAKDLLRESSAKTPNRDIVREALACLLCETGVFDPRDADLVISILEAR